MGAKINKSSTYKNNSIALAMFCFKSEKKINEQYKWNGPQCYIHYELS